MIRIDREQISPPGRLEKVREAELGKLRAFYQQNARFQRQRKTSFDVRALSGDDVKDALLAVSHGKCAYCETMVDTDMAIDQFRPKRGAVRGDGRVDTDHYWWLAFDWENQLPSCYPCSRNKGSRFPLNGPAASPEERGEALQREQPLLLDPAADFPSEHLWVDGTGEIMALSDRGDATIAILDLNRTELVAGRAGAYAAALRLFVDARSDPDLDEEVQRQLDGLMAYTLARRSAYEAASDTAPPVAEKRKKAAKYTVIQESASTAAEAPGGLAIWIERIEARNFMGLREFVLDFPATSDPEREPWIIMLGQNGVGKSSILKAVALALADPEVRARYYPDASVFLNRDTSERSGHVTVYLNRGDPVELRFRKWNKEFTATQEPPPINLLGYGATRLPPPIDRPTATEPSRFRVGNLFDPWEVLSDAEQWLTDTERVKPAQFDRLASSLRELLTLDRDDEIIRYRRKMYVRHGHARVPLRQLSDGYQSVVALAMDIMLNLAHDWSLMETAEGTVLLDEIEVHLHPQWKVAIVDSLRRLFPRLRFIASTHDPLCLSGALEGEVHILERNPSGVVEARPVDIPPGTRADQVLTGDWFGLSTTLDDGTIDLMEEHRRMLLLPEHEQDGDRREELVSELKKRLGTYADTSVDQMALQAAAEVIGEQDIRQLDAEERKRARDNILRMVREKAN